MELKVHLRPSQLTTSVKGTGINIAHVTQQRAKIFFACLMNYTITHDFFCFAFFTLGKRRVRQQYFKFDKRRAL